MIDQNSWQKSEGNLPEVSMIIKDSSSGKYHNLCWKGSSCQQIQDSGMLGRSVRDLIANHKCQTEEPSELVTD